MQPPATDPGMQPPATDPGMQPPAAPPAFPPTALERPTRGTRNLFTELLGVPEDQVNGKIVQAVNRFFGIGTNESTTPVLDTGFRVYYQLPQDPSMAFIWTSDTNDIRSEGMSYGMMIALQMDLQQEFDNLWRFARQFMQFPANSNITSWRYNFRWQGAVNTSNPNNWQVNFGANTGPAPDGDEYFAAALYLADRRWGSGSTGINYQQDADNIANAMINNPSANGNTPLFNAGNNLVVFFPSGNSAQFSDPSYVLPAFYELFAIDGSPQNAARWNAIADAGRNFLVASAHPTTGLHPDYANFNGSPNTGGSDHDDFKYDAWRVIMNMAVDYEWFDNRDARWTTQANKYHAFFTSQLNGNNVRNALFNVDGSNPNGGSSTALTLTLASGAAASSAPNRADFVQAAWDLGQQSGQYRYYQECVYILALLSAGGVYGYEWAQ